MSEPCNIEMLDAFRQQVAELRAENEHLKTMVYQLMTEREKIKHIVDRDTFLAESEAVLSRFANSITISSSRGWLPLEDVRPLLQWESLNGFRIARDAFLAKHGDKMKREADDE